MKLDWEIALRAVEVALIIANIGWFVFLSILQGRFATKKDAETAQDRADAAHHEIALVRKDIAGLPDYDKLNRLADTVNRIDKHLTETSTKVGNMGERLEDVRDGMRTIEDIVRKLK